MGGLTVSRDEVDTKHDVATQQLDAACVDFMKLCVHVLHELQLVSAVEDDEKVLTPCVTVLRREMDTKRNVDTQRLDAVHFDALELAIHVLNSLQFVRAVENDDKLVRK